VSALSAWDWIFVFSTTVYNLVRLRTLIVEAAAKDEPDPTGRKCRSCDPSITENLPCSASMISFSRLPRRELLDATCFSVLHILGVAPACQHCPRCATIAQDGSARPGIGIRDAPSHGYGGMTSPLYPRIAARMAILSSPPSDGRRIM